jgi:hypothetical protein
MQAIASDVPRRRFLASAATLGAGAAIGSTVSFPATTMTAAAGSDRDLVHDELVRQMKAGVRALRGPRPGEGARALSSTLRVLAVHFQTKGVDEDLKTRLRAAIARDGRDALLQHDPDAAMLAAEARDWGVDVPLPRDPFDPAARDRALREMLDSGATPALLTAAEQLARLAPQLDRQPASLVARRQCSGATGMAYSLEFVALASCLLNPILCAGFSGAYFGLKLGLYFAGC